MSSRNIPRNLIQFWHQSNAIPDAIRSAMDATRSINDNYEYVLADDGFMCRHISEYYGTSTLNLYRQIAIPAARSDLARLMLLYHHGGLYLDCSVEMHTHLDDIITDRDEIVLVRRDDKGIYRNLPENAHVINGIMAAPAKSPFIKWCMQAVLANLVEGSYNDRVNLATGPAVINMAAYALADKHRIRKLSYARLRQKALTHRRAKGVTNSWLSSQAKGIIPKQRYIEHGGGTRKTWSIGNLWLHVSIGYLRVKNHD